MSRHKSRLDRLTRGMGSSAEDFRSARWDRMTDEELLAEVVVEAVKLGFNPEVARTDPDAAIAWIDAEGDRIAALAVEAGFDPELARKDRVAAVRWHEGRGGDGCEPAEDVPNEPSRETRTE